MRKKLISLSLITAVVLSVAVTYMVYAQAGGTDDPVISLSYLKQVFMPQVKEELSFKVVNVAKGKSIICSAGTELIQRMGSSKITATSKGGVADTTAGYDLPDGYETPSNHLLIVPVADGRGVKAVSDCIFLVKGSYEIK